MHTPAGLFGTREAALSQDDEVWLARVAGTGWAVINRDVSISRKPDELAAYQRAGVHMFYLPGEAKVAELVHLMEANLAAIGTETMGRQPRLWYVKPSGLEEIRFSTRSR
ncbi:hypothetical protein GCM10023321_38210 [Pseudonocardia eucalypti]|uniref:VapC45 PIN like domain-containing protein n=1 Tax=Pseudonocardia eucalypti TaxID=648755 RepID=A0ABP9Q884_9PSEU